MSRFPCRHSRTPMFGVSVLKENCNELDNPDRCNSAYVANSTTANFCKWNGSTHKCEKSFACDADLCRHKPLDGTFGVTLCSDIKDDGKQGPHFNLRRACESFFQRSKRGTGLPNHNCILGPTNACQVSNDQACLHQSEDDQKVFQELHSCPTIEHGDCKDCKDPSGGSDPVQGTEIFRHNCGFWEGDGTEVFCNCGTQK